MQSHTWTDPSGEMMIAKDCAPVSPRTKVEKRVTSLLSEGVRYTTLSDRGRAVKEELRRTKLLKARYLISVMACSGLLLAHGISA